MVKIMKKILINFLIILSVIILSGCNVSKTNVNQLGLKEKETTGYVKVNYPTITGGFNSIAWSVPVEFNFDEETIAYEFIVYKDNDFEQKELIKLVYNGKEKQSISFRSNVSYINMTYVNIIIYEESRIIGYAIISSDYNVSLGRKYTFIEKQVLFPEVIRNQKEVSRELLIELIKYQNKEYLKNYE